MVRQNTYRHMKDIKRWAPLRAEIVELWQSSEYRSIFATVGSVQTTAHAQQLIDRAIALLREPSAVWGKSKLKHDYYALTLAMGEADGDPMSFEDYEYAQVRLIAMFWATKSAEEISTRSFSLH